MEVYHGTDVSSAKIIFGPSQGIDVSLGRGELGQGFYTGTEPFMAATLARGRYEENAVVIQISLNLSEYLKLTSVIVKKQHVLKKHWDLLKKNHETKTFKYGKDVVVAPFATFDIAIQYKFETLKAQDLLNSSPIIQLL